MPLLRTYGSATVVAIEDAISTFFLPRDQALLGANARLWREADERDPHAVTSRREWLLRFRCFAILLDSGDTVLVDAGIGPTAYQWPRVPGRLPSELAAAGIAPEQVTAVVLTHLHSDHIGWVVVDQRPYFPNARYVLQRAEVAALGAAGSSAEHRVIQPLRRAGLLQLVDGTAKLGPGLSTLATPGHTPGHQSVLLSTAERPLVITGDVIVHTIQLLDPSISFRYESDPAAAWRSRVGVLAQLFEVGGELATAHLGEAFVSVEKGAHPSAR